MNVRKKLLTMLMALCLLVGMVPLSVSAQSTLVWPVPGHTNRTQSFVAGVHEGIDISDANISGADIVAAMGGTVRNIWLSNCNHPGDSDPDGSCCYGFGTGLVIQGDDGRIYQYAHMLPGSIPANVYRNAYVSAGQKIGQVGNSGNSYGTHLHFGISTGSSWHIGLIDPMLENYTYDTTPVPVSLTWSGDRCEPDSSNVFVYTEAHTNIKGSFTEAGVTVWDESGNVVASKSEDPARTGTQLNIWYNITNETGVTLKSGTNYTYQLYTVFNGTKYTTDVKSFRTKGQAENTWTQELNIADWTYGETPNTPTASAKYGTPFFTYSDEKDGIYRAEVPQAAGTYYVKAIVAAVNDQYTGLEAVKEFHIDKADPDYSIPQDLTMTYTDRLGSVELPEGFSWYDITELSGPVGQRIALAFFTPADTDNYNVIEMIEIPITVYAKDLSGMKLKGIDKNTDLDNYEIKDGEVVLVKDTDYKISSETKGDTVTVTVEFKGNYTGKTQTSYSLKEQITDTNKDNTEDSNKKSEEDVPKTGDDFEFGVWAAVLILAGGAAMVTAGKRKYNR